MFWDQVSAVLGSSVVEEIQEFSMWKTLYFQENSQTSAAISSYLLHFHGGCTIIPTIQTHQLARELDLSHLEI